MGPSGLHKIQDALGGRQVGSGRITMAIKELTRQLNYLRPMTLECPAPPQSCGFPHQAARVCRQSPLRVCNIDPVVPR